MMKMKSHAVEGPPCRHMRRLLERAADGREHGLFAKYAKAHAARCRNCARYLGSLEEMILRLHNARAIEDAEALERLYKRLDKSEKS